MTENKDLVKQAKHNKNNTTAVHWQRCVKRAPEPIQIATEWPNGNNLNNKRSKVVLDYIPQAYNKSSWVHTDINKWVNKQMNGGE